MPLDDHVDAHLLGEREELADLGEQGLRRPGEVAAIADQPLNCGLTCLQQCAPGGECHLDPPGLVDSWSQVPVDRTTELIHPDHLLSPPEASSWAFPAVRPFRRRDSSTAYPK